MGSAHCFQSPVHSTNPLLNFPDVHGLQPKLDCGAKEIKVSLDKCLLGGLGFGDKVIAYLRDGNCSSTMQRQDRNWISVTSPTQARACGNILEVSGVYTTAARGWQLGCEAQLSSCKTLVKSLSLSGPLVEGEITHS